jgi:hypothetical protein
LWQKRKLSEVEPGLVEPAVVEPALVELVELVVVEPAVVGAAVVEPGVVGAAVVEAAVVEVVAPNASLTPAVGTPTARRRAGARPKVAACPLLLVMATRGGLAPPSPSYSPLLMCLALLPRSGWRRRPG